MNRLELPCEVRLQEEAMIFFSSRPNLVPKQPSVQGYHGPFQVGKALGVYK